MDGHLDARQTVATKGKGAFAQQMGNGHILFTKGPACFWKDATYEGDFAHHQRHGFGTLSWSDGESYEG